MNGYSMPALLTVLWERRPNMDITLGSHQYVTAGQLDTFTQLHIARKLGPVIPTIEGLIARRNEGKPKGILTVLMLSSLDDVDAEYVVKKCLNMVLRKQPDGKGAKLLSSDGSLMFDDTPMNDLLELTVAVIEENLGDFFRTALDNFNQAGAQI